MWRSSGDPCPELSVWPGWVSLGYQKPSRPLHGAVLLNGHPRSTCSGVNSVVEESQETNRDHGLRTCSVPVTV